MSKFGIEIFWVDISIGESPGIFHCNFVYGLHSFGVNVLGHVFECALKQGLSQILKIKLIRIF